METLPERLLIMCTQKNLVVSLVLAISMVGVSYGAGGNLPGDGLSESTAYLIEDLADFDVFADPCNSATYWAGGVYTKLTCDPNLTGRPYTTAVIASDTSTRRGFQGTPFSGIFDGNGRIISNLTIDTAGAGNDYLGLFGRIEGSGAEVENLGIENINITGGVVSGYLGGLCGWNGEGLITNCYATGSITGGHDLGGLCGYNNEGTITNCYATGAVTGGDYSCYLGGLCGHNYGTISNCYATGSVTGGVSFCSLGGLCGSNSYGTITNCYAVGSVTGGDDSYNLGGLCGKNGSGTITNCYATGAVTGGDDSEYLGGLCGYDKGTISNCYVAGLVTGGDDSYNLGGLCGYKDSGTITNCYFYLLSGPDNGWGTALDDLQMQEASSFAGFDFAGNSNDGEDDYWTIVNGYCPKLTWQTDDGPSVSPPVTTLSGSGYSYNPFQINSYADFTEFRTNSSLRCGYYILAIDIDLSSETFTTAVIGCFGGHFDGNGYIISNITIDAAGADNDCLGLFSRFYYASASDLGIENINITGGGDSDFLGGLCGRNWEGTITNCYATGSVTGGDGSWYLGGLCGYNWYGTITNCHANGSVTGGNSLGGLCGRNDEGTITNCYATGLVTGVGGNYSDSLGGLCGSNNDTITNCYAAGSVTGDDHLGGLCGSNSNGTITNCYAAGSVTGDDNLGGLCGKNNEGTITNCYAAGSITGDDCLGGLCGYNRNGTITNCYATGSVTGGTESDNLGGLCGENYYGPITNCYATGLVTGDDHLGGLCGSNSEGTITNCYFYLFSGLDNGLGAALDDLQMQDSASFAGFDFAGNSNDGEDDYWTIVNGHCPKLTWQTDDGPLVSPPVTTLSGSGYSYNPFQINSYADFTEFRTNSGLRYGYYILTTDIDLSGETFTTAVISGVFGGHFDGNGHIISNITIDTAGANNNYLGLFNRFYRASVSNLGIENINITGGDDSDYLGGLCGHNRYGTITNCYATGSVIGGVYSGYLGGLCGKNYGTITNCYATGSVIGEYHSGYLGGLCGKNYGTITNCYAAGSVTGSYALGCLCGKNESGTITNCYAAGSVTGGDYSSSLGSLCGGNSGTITNCYATGSVTGGYDASSLGGLCGGNFDGTITNCYATGNVNGRVDSHSLGGLCGENSGTIINCYALGRVRGWDDSSALGGLCGYNSSGTIANCYATGSVTGDRHLGGLCGSNGSSSTITNCFWDVETSGMTDGVGNEDPDPAGVIGKTTAQMQTESTFTDANWDFTVVPVWRMCVDGIDYPKLSWQFLAGDFVCPDGVDLADFATLSNAWLSDDTPTANWNEGCDLDGSGVIDIGDLKIFAEHWLAGK